MIDAKSLRIGNLLSDKLTGELLKVAEVSETGYSTKVIDRSKYPLPDGWQAEPIPLTEEWLVRLGAEQHEGDFWIDSFKLWYDETDKCWGVNYCGETLRRIHSVHEWQNLFYIIKGTELEVWNG